MTDTHLGGTFTLPGTTLQLKRMGYGTMQLPGPHVWGPPRDKASALAVLRQAVALGANHIDTAEFYGPHVANALIREALHPYRDEVVIVTKIGFSRGADASWNIDVSPASLKRQVHQNLASLGLEALDVVNLRLGTPMDTDESSVAEPVACLAELQREGLVRHIGLSNVTARQVEQAQSLARIVCVQNQYNLVTRNDDALIDVLAQQGIAYVPFFPLGGFSPLRRSCCRALPGSWLRLRSRSPWHGCCSARPTSWSSLAHRRCRICRRTSPLPRCACRPRRWQRSTVSPPRPAVRIESG